MERPVKISAVSYLNTIPFDYGILSHTTPGQFLLELDVPSVCARKLKEGVVDIALVPAGAIPDFNNPVILPEFCIGAVQKVKTVLLLSHEPLEKIKKVYLDFDSRTSVQLAKVLAREYWKIEPDWVNLKSGEAGNNTGKEAIVAIGDKTFELVKRFPYVYDLAEEWIRFTSLPFVFAVWMTTKSLPEEILQSLEKALLYGISHKPEALQYFTDKLPLGVDCLGYLQENISYQFDDMKKAGLEMFLSFIKGITNYELRITN